MEKWEVRAAGYIDMFDNLKAAKRAFGSIKKEINDEEEGYVEMYHRADDKSPWIMHQRFYLGVEPPKEKRS